MRRRGCGRFITYSAQVGFEVKSCRLTTNAASATVVFNKERGLLDSYDLNVDMMVRVVAVSAQGVPFFEEDLVLSKSGLASSSFRLLRNMTGNFRIDVVELSKPQE